MMPESGDEICFTILDETTLCGKRYRAPSLKVAKDGMICDECVAVMWKEQYRRKYLVKRGAEAPKAEAPKAKPVGWISPGEDDFFGPVENANGAVYLSHYLEASE